MVNFPLSRPVATGQAGHALLHTIDRDAINDLHERLVQAVTDLAGIRDDLDNLPAPEPGAPGAPGGSDEATAAWVQAGEETRSALGEFMRLGQANGTAPLGGDARVPDENLPARLADKKDFLVAEPAAGAGISDVPYLRTLATLAKALGRGVQLRGEDYRLRDFTETLPDGTTQPGDPLLDWPHDVPLHGIIGKTRLVCGAVGAGIRFGEVVGGKTGTFDVRGIRIHGSSLAVTPLKIGRSVESIFEHVQVAGGAWGPNPAFPAPAATIETTQNARFNYFAVQDNAGGGVMYSMGANNLSFKHCIFTKNAVFNHWFTAVVSEIPDVPDQTPANMKFDACMSEQVKIGVNSVTGETIPSHNIRINSGRLITFYGGSQCSRNTDDFPTILMEQTIPARPIGSVVWNTGQMRCCRVPESPGSEVKVPSGVIALVLNGTLTVGGGAMLVDATHAFVIGDDGYVRLDTAHSTSSVGNLFAKAPGATKSVHELYELGGQVYRRLQAPLTVSSTAAVDVPNMGVPVRPGQTIPIEYDLAPVQGADDATDLALSWGFPAGVKIAWAALGLAETATSPASAGTRIFREQGDTLKIGIIGSQPTAITVRATITCPTTSAGGTVTPRLAQGTAGGNVTVTDAILHGRRTA